MKTFYIQVGWGYKARSEKKIGKKGKLVIREGKRKN